MLSLPFALLGYSDRLLVQFQAILEVIKVGVPLIVEKPLVFELDEADQLLQAAASQCLERAWPCEIGTRFVENHQRLNLGQIISALRDVHKIKLLRSV